MAVTIKGRELTLPIVQGGMGIGVSMDGLAGAVAACGGMGTLSSAMAGFREKDFSADPRGANLRALDRQVRRAKERAGGAGMVAVNVMVATSQYADSVVTALKAGADAIVCGAGLPKNLPTLAAQVPESTAALAPIVSSGRAAALICKLWERQGRIPDFVVLEGPLAGGHLGVSPEEAAEAQQKGEGRLTPLLQDVRKALQPFEENYEKEIPIFVAGGIKNGQEMGAYMKQGAAGAQFATRFITTEECDTSREHKQLLLNRTKEDIAIVKSPVGMPGRALRSPLISRVEEGSQSRIQRCSRCILPCNPAKSPYCISKALIAAAQGDWENGLFFCGANVADKQCITTVNEELKQIMEEWRQGQ